MMTKDQKYVLKAIGIHKDVKVKSDNGHTKFISSKVDGVIILPRKIKNPKVYIKEYYAKLKAA